MISRPNAPDNDRPITFTCDTLQLQQIKHIKLRNKIHNWTIFTQEGN